MKVLKFGGSSVGSVPNILNVKQIVESIDDQVIVVVSALGGITDKLIETSHMAEKGNAAYTAEIHEIINRHMKMVHAIIPCCKHRELLLGKLNDLFNELQQLVDEVFIKRQLSSETAAAIVSYGERLSSLIVSCLIKGSSWFDSRNFIKTEKRHNKYNLDSELTTQLVKENLKNCPKVSLIPGFISTDKYTGETTNLGRGGSDYTASIIASALEADSLEIWTDVDGFMTADPRVISSAHPIDELSYEEAIQLCNYGAKVIYPPTIHPVCVKEIPIIIKNTMHPDAPGTIIKRGTHLLSNSIKGISSIKNTSLISITGSHVFPVEKIRKLLMQELGKNEIEMFWLSKRNSTDPITIGIHPEDEKMACDIIRNTCKTINGNYERELDIQLKHNLSMITIVGKEMTKETNLLNSLLGGLAHHGVQVIASTQESDENNFSFITTNNSLYEAMHIAHDFFFRDEVQSHSIAS